MRACLFGFVVGLLCAGLVNAGIRRHLQVEVATLREERRNFIALGRAAERLGEACQAALGSPRR